MSLSVLGKYHHPKASSIVITHDATETSPTDARAHRIDDLAPTTVHRAFPIIPAVASIDDNPATFPLRRAPTESPIDNNHSVLDRTNNSSPLTLLRRVVPGARQEGENSSNRANSPSNHSESSEPKERDSNLRVQVEKQICIGKLTWSYVISRMLLSPSVLKSKEFHQLIPPEYSPLISRGKMHGRIKQWRRTLHHFDSIAGGEQCIQDVRNGRPISTKNNLEGIDHSSERFPYLLNERGMRSGINWEEIEKSLGSYASSDRLPAIKQELDKCCLSRYPS